MKKATAVIMSMVLAISLVGCGGAPSNSTATSVESASEVESTESTTPENKSETSDKDTNTGSYEISGTINCEITQGVNERGESSLMLIYTNDTNFPIIGGEFYYKLKDNRTDDENILLKQLQDKAEMSDEDIDRYAYFISYNNCYTAPSETSKPSAYTFLVSNTINNTDYLSLAGDERISIIYLANDKLYSAYYSSTSQTFSSPNLVGNAFEWFTSDKGAAIPTLEGCPTSVSSDDPDYGFVNIYNVTLDAYEAYVEACKEAGYSKVDFDGGSNVSLSNDAGTSLSISYESASNEMVVRFD